MYITLSGGGFKGLMYIGMLDAFKKHKYSLKNLKGISGTSIGALFGLTLLLGVETSVISELTTPLLSSFDRYTAEFNIQNLFQTYGLNDGEFLRHAIESVLSHVGLSRFITMQHLYEYFPTEFVCVATNLSKNESVFFSYKTHPNLQVIDAIFMSMCVPIMFKPFHFENDMYVDGSLMMDIPTYFPSEETFCVELCFKSIEIKNSFQYLYSLVTCGMLLQRHEYTNVLQLKLPDSVDVNMTDRRVSRLMIQVLIQTGYACTLKYLFEDFSCAIEKVLLVALESFVRFENVSDEQIPQHL